MNGTAATILRHVESLGYAVEVEQAPAGGVAMRASRVEPPEDHRVALGGDEAGDLLYRCACLLAESVGVDLEDG